MAFDEEVKIGTRFLCDGYFGTVRYIGPVPPTDGLWLGVEWDNPSRGKHNGSYEGKQYFVTRYPSSGSFLRPKGAEFGVSCLVAIRDRYCQKASVTDQKKDNELYIVTKNNLIFPVEPVGLDKIEAKQSQLDKLTEVSIARMKVSHAGPPEELQRNMCNITELDLSQNLLCSWEEVSKITEQLCRLTVLNLSDNRLEIPDKPEILQSAFKNLQVVILSKIDCNWQQVFTCCRMWPQLRELRVPFNNISSLEMPSTDDLKYLEYLDLEGNSLVEWSEVNKLGKLPKLKTINLNDTRISKIFFDDVPEDGKSNMFQNLECLLLQSNDLKQWSDINELNKLSSLVEIALRNNMIAKLETDDTCRQIIIAKIAKLTILNRTTINSDERRGAELDYLKKYGKEWLKFESMPAPIAKKIFLKDHPRYLELIRIYGAPEESEVHIRSNTLQEALLSIKITCSKLKDKKSIIRKLPGSLSVNKLRSVIQRLYKPDVHKLTMVCISNKNPDQRVELDNDMRQLSFYLDDGDEILVDW